MQTRTADYGIPPSSYRLPAATHIGRVRLQVADLGRSIAYYERVLGMRTLEHEGARAVLGTVERDVALVELHERVGAAPVPPRGRFGLYHFAILLPQRADLGRFAKHLLHRRVEAGASDHLVSEALYLHDPDGLGIEVYADRPRESWRHTERQLVMDTRPLELEDVMEAAGDTRWTGMPAGTTIGHVHLHVGDIASASAFYHDALGFDRIVWSYPGALFLSAGGYHHHLGVNTWAGPHAHSPAPGDAQLLEWQLVVPSTDDAARAAHSLAGAGYGVDADGDARRAADPWGTVLRITPAV